MRTWESFAFGTRACNMEDSGFSDGDSRFGV
jgi:hypothetical protein